MYIFMKDNSGVFLENAKLYLDEAGFHSVELNGKPYLKKDGCVKQVDMPKEAMRLMTEVDKRIIKEFNER